MSYTRDSSEDLIYNSQTGQYEPVPSTVTLTINPTPNDATVTLTAAGYTQVGNSITVDIGTEVSYTVEKIGYATRSSTITVTEDQTLSIELILLTYTLTIDPTPADATVTLSATGYTQVGNSITVPYGTSVVYYVTKDGYTPVSNQTTVTADNTIAVTMIPIDYTLTINPTPNDASIIFNTGTVSGNTCTVPYNTSVTYTVSKNKYVSQSATVTVLADQTINVTLNKQQVTLTLNSVPVDAKKEIYVGSSQTPIIIASTYVTDIDTTLTYKVSKSKYVTVRDTIVMDTNKTIEVELQEGYWVKDLDAASVFVENAIINSVDLHDKPWVNSSMVNAFVNCTNLTAVTNIHNAVTNMYGAFINCTSLINAPEIPNSVTDTTISFYNCTNLVNAPVIPNSVTTMRTMFSYCTNLVTPPAIPNSVVDLQDTFTQCFNLTTAPVIPNSVTQMYGTFYNCSSLSVAPVIPNSVTNMHGTFGRCYTLTTTPVIPDSVINIGYAFAHCRNLVSAEIASTSVTDISLTFQDCVNLTGNINIASTQITNATNCFAYTSLPKNVYIPFTYANGVNTATYNAFIAAGYDEIGTQHGVYLKNVNGRTLTINPTPADATVTFNTPGTVSGNSITVDVDTDVTYVITKDGYFPSSEETVRVTSDMTINAPELQSYTIYESFNNSSSTVNTTITVPETGRYRITLVGGGSHQSGEYHLNYTPTTATGYTGGGGAGLIVDVNLDKEIEYALQVGRYGYWARPGMFYEGYPATDSSLSYTENGVTHSLLAGKGEASDYSVGGVGGVTSITNWPIIITILNANGNNGNYMEPMTNITSETVIPAVAGAASVITGTDYGASKTIASYTPSGSGGYNRGSGYGGYAKVQYIGPNT